MKRKLESGEALDVRKEGREIEPGIYELREFKEGLDYCDSEIEEWIWSIGKSEKTGQIVASTGTVFYQREGWECLFLR
jgi:hypothetical protein